jgi:signal transduction histidine kinase/GAF domain-containing protein/ActR/RegA family two-component response regulator
MHVEMNPSSTGRGKINWLLIAASALTLVICLGYAFASVFLTVDPGFEFDQNWRIFSIEECDPIVGWCDARVDELQIGDEILRIGDLSNKEYLFDYSVVLFEGVKPGDVIPILINRDGERILVNWYVPSIPFIDRVAELAGLVFSIPLWIVGTVILLLVRPHDERWWLMISFSYITAIWLSAGYVSSGGVLYSTFIMAGCSWIMMPIYLHLHLVVPKPLPRQRPRQFLPFLYGVAAILSILTFLQQLPPQIHLYGVIIGVCGSVGLLVFHAFFRKDPEVRVATRLMLASIGLAFGPGILLYIVPLVSGAVLPGLLVTVLTGIAVPILPLAYGYAIFKRNFGDLEFRANRLLSVYSFLLIYATLFSVIFLYTSRMLPTKDSLAVFAVIVATLFVIAAPTFQSRFQRVFEKLAYGAIHDPEEILSLFTENLPSATDRTSFAHFIADQILPTLLIRQSSLYLIEGSNFRKLFSRGTPDLTPTADEIRRMMIRTGRYRPTVGSQGNLDWVRLAVPLEVRDRTIGIWFFGSRDPDDFYPFQDIHLLTTLASQVALAIDNTRLYNESKRQMEELAGLYDIAIATGSELDTEKLLKRLYQQVERLLPMDTFAVMLFDPIADEYEVVLVVENGELLKDAVGKRHSLSSGGLTGWVMRSGKAFLADDLTSDTLPVDPKHVVGEARSWLGVPLVARERLIGAVSIQAFEAQVFSENDLRFLEVLAGQVAIALENALLFDETRHRATQQESLNAVIATVSSAPELPVLLELALDHSMRALGTEQGAVWLIDPSLKYVQNLSKDYTRIAARAVDMAIEDGRSILTVDDWEIVPSDLPWSRTAHGMTSYKVRSSLTVPLIVESRRIGGLSLANSSTRQWLEDEQELAKAIGRQLGGAVERLRLLDQIQEKAREVQRILDTVQEGILTLDEDRRITQANPAAQRYFKILCDVGVGEVLQQLGGTDLSELLIPRPGGIPHTLQIGDPPEHVFEVVSSLFTIEAEIRGWTVLIREVTEAHHVQKVAEQQDRLAAVGQLAAGIAHDFNNIMAAIILYTEMLITQPEIDQRGQDRLSTILQQAQRAATLTRQILDFSRQAVIDQYPMDLIPFVKELEKLLRRTLEENINLYLKYEPGEYVMRADPGRMQQVFMNLAVNARDAMPEGGDLTFHISKETIRAHESPPIRDMPPGEWVRIDVSDTGAGISAKVLPHIFEPFFTTKAPGVGTGLGLAQVYGIVKQHDGFIEVKSEEGKGTTFTMYLPAMIVKESAAPLPETGGFKHGKGETILVVEDDVATREGVREVLELLNYKVVVAQDGREALEIFNAQPHVDLVITDLVMPGVGGMSLYKTLKKKVPDIKVVMMTGYPLGDGTRELLDQGQVIWIQKPLNSSTLGRTISEALQNKVETPR